MKYLVSESPYRTDCTQGNHQMDMSGKRGRRGRTAGASDGEKGYFSGLALDPLDTTRFRYYPYFKLLKRNGPERVKNSFKREKSFKFEADLLHHPMHCRKQCRPDTTVFTKLLENLKGDLLNVTKLS